ncbi:MAG: hypothetical protein KDD66_07155 [Bdellovibrionales bacterium]|nr:hypothetical protein [Bdellovibrionales bacterium]
MPRPSLSDDFTPAIIAAWIDDSISAGKMTAGTAKGYRRGGRLLLERSASVCGLSLDETREQQALESLRVNGVQTVETAATSVTQYFAANVAQCVQEFTDHLYVTRVDRRKAQELISQVRNFCAWLRNKGWSTLDPSSIENPIVKPQLVTLPIVRMWTSEWVAASRVKPLTAQNYRNAAMQFVMFVGATYKLEVHMVRDRQALERMLEAVKNQQDIDAQEPATITDWLCGSRTKGSIEQYLRHLQQTGTTPKDGTVIVSNLRMFVEWMHSAGLTSLKPAEVKSPFKSGSGIAVHPIVSAWLNCRLADASLSADSAKNYERKVRALIDALADEYSCPLDTKHETAMFELIRLAAPERWVPQPDAEQSIAALICLEGAVSIPRALQRIADNGGSSQVIMNQIASAVRKMLEYLQELGIPIVEPSTVATPAVAQIPAEAAAEPEPMVEPVVERSDAGQPPEAALADEAEATTPEAAPAARSSDSKPPKAKTTKKAAKKTGRTTKPASGRPKTSEVVRLVVPRREILADKSIPEIILRRNSLIEKLIRDDGQTFRQIRDWRYIDFKPTSRSLAIRDQDGGWRDWQPDMETMPALLAYHRKVSASSLSEVWKLDHAPLFLSGDGGELTVDDELRPNTPEWTTVMLRDTAVTNLVAEGLSFEEVLLLRNGSVASITQAVTTTISVFDAAGKSTRSHTIGARTTESLRSYMEAIRVVGLGGRDASAPLLVSADGSTLTADDVLP